MPSSGTIAASSAWFRGSWCSGVSAGGRASRTSGAAQPRRPRCVIQLPDVGLPSNITPTKPISSLAGRASASRTTLSSRTCPTSRCTSPSPSRAPTPARRRRDGESLPVTSPGSLFHSRPLRRSMVLLQRSPPPQVFINYGDNGASLDSQGFPPFGKARTLRTFNSIAHLPRLYTTTPVRRPHAASQRGTRSTPERRFRR